MSKRGQASEGRSRIQCVICFDDRDWQGHFRPCLKDNEWLREPSLRRIEPRGSSADDLPHGKRIKPHLTVVMTDVHQVLFWGWVAVLLRLFPTTRSNSVAKRAAFATDEWNRVRRSCARRALSTYQAGSKADCERTWSVSSASSMKIGITIGTTGLRPR